MNNTFLVPLLFRMFLLKGNIKGVIDPTEQADERKEWLIKEDVSN